MSIEVVNLSKTYGTQQAVQNISFSVKRGEVLGFLGPNGAGKSTTMRMLTGFLPPTGGTASVAGFNVETDGLEARRRTGYLPEANPLYPDMYVAEYLEHAARFYQVANPRAKVADMIALTGLTPERKKRIGQLSKGYRQRVGLAQALVHDPEVLILDEPTSGLDPNQLADIRKLITELAREKTVVLSTHIMQEVQAMCTRTVILAGGRIVADAPIGALQASATQILVELDAPMSAAAADALQAAVPGITVQPEAGANATYLLTPPASEGDVRPRLFAWAVAQNHQLLSLQQRTESLEDTFRRLTQAEPHSSARKV